MKTLALTTKNQLILPKMGIMTNIVELSRHDFIYVKDLLKCEDVIYIKKDQNRFWNKDALAVFYKEFKLGYLNDSIAKVVNRLINKFGEINVTIKNLPKSSNPFSGIDILIKLI
tara:strand:+ start:42620 stop:42961 length:342 start_codon:yes stop_codon:yes gene_type:complete